MTKTNELPSEVSVADFAALVAVTPRRIAQLVEEGVVVRTGRGRIALASSIRGMLEAARAERQEAPLATARAKAADARAALTQLRLEREAGRLIEVEQAMYVVDVVAGRVNEVLASFPARLAGRDLAERARIEAAVDAMREDLIERLQRERRALRPAP